MQPNGGNKFCYSGRGSLRKVALQGFFALDFRESL
jgi:hypothetical protein